MNKASIAKRHAIIIHQKWYEQIMNKAPIAKRYVIIIHQKWYEENCYLINQARYMSAYA